MSEVVAQSSPLKTLRGLEKRQQAALCPPATLVDVQATIEDTEVVIANPLPLPGETVRACRGRHQRARALIAEKYAQSLQDMSEKRASGEALSEYGQARLVEGVSFFAARPDLSCGQQLIAAARDETNG